MINRIYFFENAIFLDTMPVPFVAGTLEARMKGEQIEIRRAGSPFVFQTPHWSAVARQNGTTFDTPGEALAYLDGEFGKRRPVGLVPLTFTAGAPLGGHKVVRIASGGSVLLASSDDLSQIGTVLGVTVNAADEGTPVAVMVMGEMDEPTWDFAPGAVFLGLDGGLTQVPPATGFIQQIATAVSSTTLVVERSAPIVLAQ